MLAGKTRRLVLGVALSTALVGLAIGLKILFKSMTSNRTQVGTPSELRIALILPTGESVPQDVMQGALAAQQGALLAIERRNDASGVLGLPVEAVRFDSKCDQEGTGPMSSPSPMRGRHKP